MKQFHTIVRKAYRRHMTEVVTYVNSNAIYYGKKLRSTAERIANCSFDAESEYVYACRMADLAGWCAKLADAMESRQAAGLVPKDEIFQRCLGHLRRTEERAIDQAIKFGYLDDADDIWMFPESSQQIAIDCLLGFRGLPGLQREMMSVGMHHTALLAMRTTGLTAQELAIILSAD